MAAKKKPSLKQLPTPQQVQDVKEAIDILIRVCNKHKFAVGGFVFGVKPIMLNNFGNTKEAKTAEFYEKLVELADARRTAGDVQHQTVGRVQ
ncbi:Uncharacterised protein [uncultured archaeon]|nr:Uncharacterised protein [uncultured archaeon]